MAQSHGVGAGGQVSEENDFDINIDPNNMGAWAPLLLQALAIAKAEYRSRGIRTELCIQAFLLTLEEIRRADEATGAALGATSNENNRGAG